MRRKQQVPRFSMKRMQMARKKATIRGRAAVAANRLLKKRKI